MWVDTFLNEYRFVFFAKYTSRHSFKCAFKSQAANLMPHKLKSKSIVILLQRRRRNSSVAYANKSHFTSRCGHFIVIWSYNSFVALVSGVVFEIKRKKKKKKKIVIVVFLKLKEKKEKKNRSRHTSNSRLSTDPPHFKGLQQK